MFCNVCGKEIKEGAAFCASCGNRVAPAAANPNPAPAPVNPVPNVPYTPAPAPAPAQPSAFGVAAKSAFEAIKGFFSKNIMKALGTSAKSNGFEWSFLLFASMFFMGFAMAIGPAAAIEGASWAGYNFGLELLKGLFLPLVAFGASTLGCWLLLSQIYKKQATWNQAANMVTFATLPVTFASILNLLLGAFVPFLGALFLFTALFMSCVLLYVGLQKIDKLDKSPFFGFSTVLFIAVAITLLMVFLVGGAGFDGIVYMFGEAFLF